MKSVIGYNVFLKYNNKTFCGVTSDDFSLSKNTKESITKDDGGNSNTTVVGNSIEFTVSGIMKITDTGDTSKIGADEIMELALKNGDAAILEDVIYDRGEGLKKYKFNAVVTSYQETTPSDGDSTYSLKLKVNGNFATTTV